VTDARKSRRSAIDGNQIYRLAASWYGVSTNVVTEEQFANARWVFSIFSAVAVAMTGSVAALVYYSRTRVPGAPTFIGQLLAKISRARRAYYARLRDPPPLKWSDLRYVFDIKEDCNGKEAIQA
jgi:hypothetical protein